MAAVRIAMTIGDAGKQEGQLFRVVDSSRNAFQGGDELRPGVILPNLTVGVDTDTAKPLRANQGVCRQGVKLGAPGFIVTTEQARRLGNRDGSNRAQPIRPYLRNKDITGRPRDVHVIALFLINERRASELYSEVYQFLLDHVKASRQQSRRKAYRDNWWIFVEPRPALRRATADLKRYIVTPEVAKFRPFVFVSGAVVPDASLYVVASDDAYILGVLSSY